MKLELSVCIPTFNRASILKESLRFLVTQCANRPVEICVSNNASSDETAGLLQSYPGIRHELRECNIGLERNMLAALRMAEGKYVLPIGDDEMIVPRGIDSILAALQTNPDMLVLNGWHKARPHLPKSLQGRTITDLTEAFRVLWDKMPLGGFVIRREYAEPGYTDRYLDTHHAYSGAVWDYLLDQPRVRIDCMSHPIVEFREVKKSWAANADAIRFREIPRWFDLIPASYSEAVIPSRRQYLRTWGKPKFSFFGRFRTHA